MLIGTDGHERLGQWGRAVHHRNGRPTLAGATNSGLTRQIAGWSILAALFIPVLIPATPQLFHLNSGSGSGNGNGTIYLDQTVNIAQDLLDPTDRPLFEYRTDAPQAQREYFQQEVLTQFNGTEWDPSSKAFPESPGTVAVPGLKNGAIAQQVVNVSVNVNGNFGFSTAPTPYATTDRLRTAAKGVAEVDKDTLTVYINDGESGSTSRKGTQYSTESTQVTPTAAQLSSATVGQDPISKGYLSLPAGVAQLLKTDAEQITAGDTTPYAKAMALQTYFTTQFTYTLTPKVSGTGVQAIESFLNTKAGFCQQFAATMAAMARALGIPAVVAIGYTPGAQESGTNAFQITDARRARLAAALLRRHRLGPVRAHAHDRHPTRDAATLDGRAQAQPWTQTQTTGDQHGEHERRRDADDLGKQQGVEVRVREQRPQSPRRRRRGGAVQHGQPGLDRSATAKAAFASWGAFGVLPRTFERWFLSGNAAQIAVKLLLLGLLLVAGLPGAFRLRRWRRRRRLLRRAAAEGGRRPKLPGQRSRSPSRTRVPAGRRLDRLRGLTGGERRPAGNSRSRRGRSCASTPRTSATAGRTATRLGSWPDGWPDRPSSTRRAPPRSAASPPSSSGRSTRRTRISRRTRRWRCRATSAGSAVPWPPRPAGRHGCGPRSCRPLRSTTSSGGGSTTDRG